MNLTPLRPLENYSDPQKRLSEQCYGATFLRHYFAELLETLIVKIVLKQMVHFFNAYRVEFGCYKIISNPLPITKTAAVLGVLDVLLRLSLGVPGFSSTVQKSPYWELVPIALIVVKHYGYGLSGVILVPLRQLEKFSDPQKRSSEQC